MAWCHILQINVSPHRKRLISEGIKVNGFVKEFEGVMP